MSSKRSSVTSELSDRQTVLSLDHPAAQAARTESDDPTFDTVWDTMIGVDGEESSHDLRLLIVEAIVESEVRLTASFIDYCKSLVDQFEQGVPDPSEYTQFCTSEIRRIAAHQREQQSITTNRERFVATFTNKEHSMETTQDGAAVTTYDSGAGTDEDTPLAAQIEAVGVTEVAAGITAGHGASVKADLANDAAGAFDPESVGMTSVLNLVGTISADEEMQLSILDAIQNACYRTRDGAKNESYISQVWLDGDLGEERLFIGYVGEDVYVIATVSVSDSQSDFTTNVPTHVRRFLTEDAAKEWARQYRPKPTEAERQAKAAERFAAAAALRKGLTTAATS